MSFVTVSYAQSVDGCIATRTGESRYISSEATLELAQGFRRDHAAILVGVGTIVADDPLLTCRLPGCVSPVRIVLDPHLRTPPASRVATTAESVRTVFIHADIAPPSNRLALGASGAEFLSLAGTDGRFDPRAVVEALAREGLESIFVEGGGGVITSFLSAGVVDRLVVVTAPILIGDGVRAIGPIGVGRLDEALKPRSVETRLVGPETVTDMRLRGARR